MNVKYEIDAEKREKIKKDYLAICFKSNLASIIAFGIIAAYCLTFGIIYQDRSTIIAGECCAVAFISVIINVRVKYVTLCKQMSGVVSRDPNDVVSIEITKDDSGVYNVKNLTLETNVKFDKRQIQKIKKGKENILIIFKSMQYVTLPALPEIIEEFGIEVKTAKTKRKR